MRKRVKILEEPPVAVQRIPLYEFYRRLKIDIWKSIALSNECMTLGLDPTKITERIVSYILQEKEDRCCRSDVRQQLATVTVDRVKAPPEGSGGSMLDIDVIVSVFHYPNGILWMHEAIRIGSECLHDRDVLEEVASLRIGDCKVLMDDLERHSYQNSISEREALALDSEINHHRLEKEACNQFIYEKIEWAELIEEFPQVALTIGNEINPYLSA